MRYAFKQHIGRILTLFAVLTAAVPFLLFSPAAQAAPAATVVRASGRLWVTGHDADYHCSTGDVNACHYFQAAVKFVMGNSTLPLLALDHGGEVAMALAAAFPTHTPKLATIDPRTIATVSVPLISSKGVPLYSAIIVASDVTCGGCDNNDSPGATPDSAAINSHRADIAAFFKAGGGILALAGARNSAVYYGFLPVSVSPTAVTPADGSPGGFTLTAFGQAFGLTNADVNCCITHNSFLFSASSSALQEAETDSAGNAETLVSSIWGVDSHEHIDFPVHGTTYYTLVTQTYHSAPSFWGRYIGTGFSKDIVLSELRFAHVRNLAILPIYFNYATPNVTKRAQGQTYARKAIIDAFGRLHIPQGVAIFVDIEVAPGVATTADFIQGWFDQFKSSFVFNSGTQSVRYPAGYYTAGYYGNPTTGTFNTAYCAAISGITPTKSNPKGTPPDPLIGTESVIWSPVPQNSGPDPRTGPSTAPAYEPATPTCTNQTVAWQYGIPPEALKKTHPVVDTDEILPNIVLWHP